MTKKVVWNNRFKRVFKKLIKRKPELKDKITQTLILLAENPFSSSLKSHKLTGNLEDFWSCSVSYDCRIIFTFKEDEHLAETLIILVDIGSHDEVY